jgi:hypothetical protein
LRHKQALDSTITFSKRMDGVYFGQVVGGARSKLFLAYLP